MRKLLTSVIIGGLMFANAAEAREVRRLAPSSEWLLEYADESCRLARHFGEGKEKVTVVLDRFDPTDEFTVTFAGAMMKPASNQRPITGRMQFGPTNADQEVTALEGTAGSQRVLLLQSGYRIAPLTKDEEKALEAARATGTYYTPAPITPEQEKAASWLALNKLMKFDLVLETGPMDKPVRALQDCVWDLVGSWGLDVEQQKGLTRRAYAGKLMDGWFSSDDYPINMLRSNAEGRVAIRLIVDAKGVPESCRIQASGRPKAFDRVVCNVMMRKARLHPALDAAGKPVRSYYTTMVYFLLG